MNTSNLTIHKVVEKDVALLAKIFNESRSFAGCFSCESTEIEDFASQIDGEEIHVAAVDDVVVGFMSVCTPENFIHHIYVLPQHQGTGIGSALIQRCVETYGVPLSLKCDTANIKAQSFYKRKGWSLGDESGTGKNGPWQRLWLNNA